MAGRAGSIRACLHTAVRHGGTGHLHAANQTARITSRSCHLLEEEQIGADRRVRLEHAVRKANDRVEVALLHQLLLESRLHAFAEERAVGKDHCGPAAWLQQPDDQREEEVGCLPRLEVRREVGLDPGLFLAAERRIGEDDVDPILLAHS